MSNTIDLMQAFYCEPPQLDFVWPGFLSGTVGALVAPGATGKSFWALQAAMAVAGGIQETDLLNLKPSKPGRVLYLAGEDPEAALVRRVHAIGQHMHQEAHQAIAQNLVLQPILGKRLDIMNHQHLRSVIEAAQGARLVVLDTLSRIHGLDENSNGDMARLISQLEYVAAQTGASVLYLHHVGKGSAREGQGDQQQAARGASALIDNARYCAFLAKMTEEESQKLFIDGLAPVRADRRGYFLRFGVSKQNYSEPIEDCWLQRQSGGVLLPVAMASASATAEKKAIKTPKKIGDDDDF